MKFRFIGNIPGKLATKSEQFIIEIAQEELDRIRQFPYPKTMTATIVEPPSVRNNHSSWYVGDTVCGFVNPFFEMHNYLHPVFVKDNNQ